MFKINNSYETEPSTSSSSVSNDCASSTLLNAEWDFKKGNNLKDYLFPPVKRQLDKDPAERNRTSKLFSMVSSSQESDFCGFSPLVAAKKNASCSQDGVNGNRTQENCIQSTDVISNGLPSSGSLLRRAIAVTECGSTQTITSEEFSDQDIRYRTEMDRLDATIRARIQETESLCNESHFTIEPTSSDDEDELSCRATALKICESTSNLHTLSVNENSNNAVDNAISSASYTTETELKDLSFNGKLKTESESTAIGNTTTNEPHYQLDKNTNNDMNISNASDKSNLELQLQMESSREHINERSPDLFSDIEDEELGENGDDVENNDENTAIEANDSITSTKSEGKENHSDSSIEKTERAISKRIQNLLCGILPPPSVTYVQHDIGSLLSMYKRNISLADPPVRNKDIIGDQLVHPIMPKVLEDAEWPQMAKINAYGLHYNRTKYTENIEMLFMKLVERNVGQETGTSFTYNVSTSAKKKPARKLMASPGNRLSHLARRRAVFSSANLQSQSQLSNLSKLGRKTCVIDASKLSRKEKVSTPRRRVIANKRTPGRKTPSSLKKSLSNAKTFASKFGTATRETSKRALFLSPTHEEVKSVTSTLASDISRRVEKSKRALFSPPRRLERSISNVSNISSTSCSNSLGMSNSSNKKNHFDRMNCFNRTNSDITMSFKRRLETDDNENMEPHRNKMQRTNEHHNNTLTKAASENSMYQNQQLSASHKQKLLWAVSTALKKKSITSTHSKFNIYGSTLGKVVKRLYMEQLPTKTESTSGTMLRLADRLVFYVLQDKSVDEIYLDEKSRMNGTKNATKRLSGYINRDEYLMRLEITSKLNSSTQSITGTDVLGASNENDNNRKPLTNSSSKSNVGTSALRENHDSKSAQKSTSNVSFSGRNQKNLSPYNDKTRSACNLNKSNKLMPATNSNILKVKRQISFDN